MGLGRIAGGMLALFLTGCVAPPKVPAPDAPPVLVPSCGAARLGGFVGQPVAALDPQYQPLVTRIIRPGDAVTEEFSPARLNVEVDGRDVITRVWCG